MLNQYTHNINEYLYIANVLFEEYIKPTEKLNGDDLDAKLQKPLINAAYKKISAQVETSALFMHYIKCDELSIELQQKDDKDFQ